MLSNKKLLVILMQLVWFTAAFAQHEHNAQPKKEDSKQSEKVIYTCPMHPDVQMNKPGDCPKCGMDLIPKKIKSTSAKPSDKKDDDMKMANDTSKEKTMDMGNMKKDEMQMPMKDSSKKMNDMDGMKMGDDSSAHDMDNMKMTKSKLGPVKTIANNLSLIHISEPTRPY